MIGSSEDNNDLTQEPITRSSERPSQSRVTVRGFANGRFAGGNSSSGDNLDAAQTAVERS